MTYEDFRELSGKEQERLIREAGSYQERDRLTEMWVKATSVPRRPYRRKLDSPAHRPVNG